MLTRRLLPSSGATTSISFALIRKANNPQVFPLFIRGLSTNVKKEVGASAVHFRVSTTPHPLGGKAKVDPDKDLGDHIGRQQNHIWSEDELKEKLSKLYHHK
jgi:hypothetical protein